jgi:hypothetical protein
VPGKSDDRDGGGDERVRGFADRPDSYIRDVVGVGQGSSTCFPRRHAKRISVVSTTKGTAVQMVIAVRSDRSGLIAFSYGVARLDEKPDPSGLPASAGFS